MNNIKTRFQEKELNKLYGKYRVILKWATGCGKSKATIDLINYAVDKYHKKVVKVLFVVAERAHIKNWQDEMFKWNLKIDKVATDVICYASLHKMENADYDIIVFDEAHHVFTEKRLNIIRTLKAKYVFLLSATLSKNKTFEIEGIYGRFTVSTVTLKDAIDSDILPDPRVYLIGLELDNTIPNQKIVIGGKDVKGPVISWEKRTKYIFKNYSCVIRCTQRQKYLYYTDTMEYWKRRYEYSHSNFHHNRWVNTGSMRKRFLGELKTRYVRRLLLTIPEDKRFVCFCASVAQAEAIAKDKTISSKRATKANQSIIDSFNAKQLNQIFAVGMITEGMNLTDIQAGIIVQLDGKERLFVQKFGRSMRAQDPVSFIFYYKDTQDEVYLKNALENIDKKYIRHITNINHLNNIKL